MRSSYDIAVDAKPVIPDGNDERRRQMTQTAEKVNHKQHFSASYDQAMTVRGSAAECCAPCGDGDRFFAKSQSLKS
jgi:hypothetical protein